LNDPDYTSGYKNSANRTVLGVPLLRRAPPIGSFSPHPVVVQPVFERQIELVQTFADQAVIAIEECALFNEVQAGTADVAGIPATADCHRDVLQVISSSPGELEPVFRPCWKTPCAFARRNSRCCFCMMRKKSSIAASEVGTYRRGVSSFGKTPFPADPRVPLGRVAVTKQPVKSRMSGDQTYLDRYPGWVARRRNPAAPGLFCKCPCSRKTSSSARSVFIARKSDPLPTSRLPWCRISPPGRHRHRECAPSQ